MANSKEKQQSTKPIATSRAEAPAKKEENRNWQFRETFNLHHKKTKETQIKLAKRIGMSPMHFGQLITGRRPVNYETGLKLAKAMNVTLDKVLPSEEINLITSCYSALDPNSEAIRCRGVRVFFYNTKQILSIMDGKKVNPTLGINTDYTEDRKLIAVKVKSNEMQPRLNKGDIVVVDLEAKPKPTDIVLVLHPTDELLYLREYAVPEITIRGEEIYELRPLDSHYPTFSNVKIPTMKILGVVIERRTIKDPVPPPPPPKA